MRISELVTLLEVLQLEHGDLRIVTPGFDECGFSDVTVVEATHIQADARQEGHWGEHVDANPDDPNAELCVNINF